MVQVVYVTWWFRLCLIYIPLLEQLFSLRQSHIHSCVDVNIIVYRRSLVYVCVYVHVYQCTVNWLTLSDEFQKNKEFQQFHKGLKMAELLLSHKYVRER